MKQSGDGRVMCSQGGKVDYGQSEDGRVMCSLGRKV